MEKRVLKKRLPEMGSYDKPKIQRASMNKTLERSAEMQKIDMMTGNFVQELMNAATSFHKLHLSVTGTGSYAQHIALNELYDALPDLADTIAEGYQGACEVILSYEDQGSAVLKSVDDAIEYMRQMKMQIDELQAVIPHSEVVSNLDLVKDAINTAKYKLLFLS
jgi:DNA-binding ferritin-like protein